MKKSACTIGIFLAPNKTYNIHVVLLQQTEKEPSASFLPIWGFEKQDCGCGRRVSGEGSEILYLGQGRAHVRV
jgi:hypothetical protein